MFCESVGEVDRSMAPETQTAFFAARRSRRPSSIQIADQPEHTVPYTWTVAAAGIGSEAKADDRRTIKSADFIGQQKIGRFLYVTRPILSPDFIGRYFRR